MVNVFWGRLVQGPGSRQFEPSLEAGREGHVYPSLRWHEGRSAVLDMHAIEGDSAAKGQ